MKRAEMKRGKNKEGEEDREGSIRKGREQARTNTMTMYFDFCLHYISSSEDGR